MIVLDGLTKRFPNGKGVSDLRFEVREGEAYGYVGPNGAGKSTTIRVLMGFMKPTGGSATMKGADCWTYASETQKLVGYLPGEISFIEGGSANHFLDLLGGMRSLKDRRRRDELIERLQLEVGTPIRKMSKGMKQKLGIVAAFMHDPAVYILDEPTSGLDPLMQRVFIDLLAEEKARGKTILMSSHMFPEIERTCDRVGFIRNGRLLFDGQISEVQKVQRRIYEVELSSPAELEQILGAPLDIVKRDGLRLRIAVQGSYDTFLRELSKYHVQSLDVHTLNLEEIFMQYYMGEEGVAG